MSEMSGRDLAMLSVIFSLIGHLSHEGIINRERLIEFLLEQLSLSDRSADTDPRLKLVNEYLETLVQMLEHTQFPQTPK